MKYAFTMIELIFVIVILGILAAVAIPRMAATKNEAKAVTIATALADCVGFSGSAYIKDTAFDTNSSSCNSATVKNLCFTLDTNNTDGTLVVQDVASAPAGSVCAEAQRLVGNSNLSSSTGVTHQF